MHPFALDARVWFLSSILSFAGETTGARSKWRTEEERLLHHLFKGYNPSARPVLNSSDTVDVNIQFSLLQIQELNIRSQVLTTTGLLILEWKDERLVWDKDVSSLDDIVVDGKMLWKPEFAVINGAEAIYENYDEFQVVLRSDGSMRWEPGGVFRTMCQINITYYPFDEQHCELTFGAWSYHTTKMNLSTTRRAVNLDTYEQNGEWDMLRTTLKRDEFFFTCCPTERFSFVTFTIFLKRKHTFYIMNVILPGILTSLVLLSIFFCTPSQKVHIGVAALLSFRLFLLNVADTIPRTSDHVPLLGIYLTCTMAITTLAMISTVFVLNLYAMRETPVPPWAKKLFIVYMARILCMCSCLTPSERATSAGSSLQNSVGGRQRRTRRGGSAVEMFYNSDGGCESRLHPDSSPLVRQRVSATGSPVPDGGGSGGRLYNGNTQSELKQTGTRTQKTPVNYAKEWMHVATVCDRLFFWLCLLFTVITTLILFHPLVTSNYFTLPVIDKQN